MAQQGSDLKGQVALVTGAGVHTGSTIARTLAAAGAAVAINYRNAKEGALESVAAIEKAGGKAIAIQGDVTNEDDVKRMIAETVKQLGRLTILVNNATKRSHCPLEDLTFKEWRDTLATTLDGTFLCTKYAVPQIRAAGGGTIVNIGGSSGHEGRADRAHVSAAKAGVAGMTAALAVELGPSNITVNCIVPGKIETVVDAHLFDEKRRAKVPTGRPARQQEIAALVRFLCGDQCRQMTGQMLHVNGGTRTSIA
ncbi:MAG: 3-oxoacyl-ACP reductase [Pseudomonadota bacterium]|jgi:3-oxoacyl-[acyl-carrier protein] reductase